MRLPTTVLAILLQSFLMSGCTYITNVTFDGKQKMTIVITKLISTTGIYRAVPMRENPRQSTVKSVYKTHIDVIHFRKTDEKRLHGLDEDSDQKLFTEERVQTLKELAAKPDVYERLSSALAPSIYEQEDIKKVSGDGYQLSVKDEFPRSNIAALRSYFLHCLLWL